MDSEVLMNKLASTGNNIVKLKQPLQSSLFALDTSQWKLAKILSEWEGMCLRLETQDLAGGVYSIAIC